MRFIGKLDIKIKDLEQLHNGINEVYSNGAVEGYAEKKLDSKTLATEHISHWVIGCLQMIGMRLNEWFSFYP